MKKRKKWTAEERAEFGRRVSRAMCDKRDGLPTAAGRAVELLRAHPNMSVDAIAAAVGITHQRVSQLAKNAGISRAALRAERKAERAARIAAARAVAAQERRAQLAARMEERKHKSIEALRAFYDTHGRSPTMRELGMRTGFSRLQCLPLGASLHRDFGSVARALDLAGIPPRPIGRPRRAAA